MALNASGPISLGGSTAGQSIAVELGLSATAQISLNDAVVRTLAGVASGAIVMPTNFWGKANAFIATITSNQTNLNLRTWALANGWNGTSSATITVGSGVYIYSTSTATPGLTIDGSWPGGLTLINLGFIQGKGGDMTTHTGSGTIGGVAGGPAISLGVSLTIDNQSGYIGGGGGSGTSRRISNFGIGAGGGGGAGGGAGGGVPGYAGFSAGGAGGGPGSSGSPGVGNFAVNPGARMLQGATSGGGGGRIMPGSGGAAGVGPIVSGTNVVPYGGQGGGAGAGAGAGTGSSAGGSAGNPGAATGYTLSSNSVNASGGGGWGASGGIGYYPTGGRVPVPVAVPGGAGGKAVNLNGFAVTWTGGFPSARVYGAVS